MNDDWDDPEPSRNAEVWDPADEARALGSRDASSAARRGVRVVGALIALAIALSLGQAGVAAISAAVGPSRSASGTSSPSVSSVSAGTANDDATDDQPAQPAIESPDPSQDETTSTNEDSGTDDESATEEPSTDLAGAGTAAVVTQVVDGDTIHVDIDGRPDKVRIIGIDTPEEHKPNTPVECYAIEADRAASELMPVGTEVRLVADPSQSTRDRFDRLLAHVILPDGRLFAEVMIERGLGIHYIYDHVPSIFADRLATAQERAKREHAGLWASTTCGGNPHTPAA